MKARNLGIGFVAAAVLVLASSLANAYTIPVTNGDFESPALTSGSVTLNTVPIPGWDKEPGSVARVWNLEGWGPGAQLPLTPLWSASAVANQHQVAILDGFSAITQTLHDSIDPSKGLKAGFTYQLSAQVGSPAGFGSGYGIGLFQDSIPLAMSFGAAPVGDFSDVSLSFKATADTSSFKIMLLSFGGPMVAFDNVSLTAVPEPSTVVGLGSLGLMGLIFVGRRWWRRG